MEHYPICIGAPEKDWFRKWDDLCSDMGEGKGVEAKRVLSNPGKALLASISHMTVTLISAAISHEEASLEGGRTAREQFREHCPHLAKDKPVQPEKIHGLWGDKIRDYLGL